MIKFVLFTALLFASLTGIGQSANGTVSKNTKIPTIADVGASKLPSDIAKVEAPFPMPDFKKPVFKNYSVNIKDQGAKPKMLATTAIQKAVDEVNKNGGGSVIVPKGIWETGRIILKSNVNLHLENGAELHFSGEVKDYLPVVFTRNEGVEVMSLGALIYANGQENIAITGNGKLVGPALDCELRKRSHLPDVIENVVPTDKPVDKRIYDGNNGGIIFPPMFISPINCRNVYIEGITIGQTPFWNIVPVYCNGVIIRGVTVNSVGIPRGDGIDIESSNNVLIEYSTLNCGDDCFTIKAGRNEDGLRVNKPSENIVIRYCLAQEGHGGITVGSETAGVIRNMYVHDCVFDQTEVGIRFKTRRSRGGGGQSLTYERIRMNLKGDAIKFDMLGTEQFVGKLAVRLPALEVNTLTPKFKDITVRDIDIEKARYFINIQGIPESPPSNVLVENALVNSERFFTASDVSGITIKNSNINISAPGTVQPGIAIIDGKNISFEKLQFNMSKEPLTSKITGDLSDNIKFIGCTPEKPEGWLKTTWTKQK